MVTAWLRRRWRIFKLSVLEDRCGNHPWLRVVYCAVQWFVTRSKGLFVRKQELSDLALWLMYHPESGILPCEGWRMLSRPPLQEELPALRRRHAEDQIGVERRLAIVDIPADRLLTEGACQRFAPKIAVHVHGYFSQYLPRIYAALEHMPYPYDLYVSVPEGSDIAVRSDLPNVGRCVVRQCPNRGRDIAPMLCLFGRELSEYEIVAHFHTKKSPHVSDGAAWLDYELDMLLGNADSIRGIVQRLTGTFGMVYAADWLAVQEDPTGWMRNRELAASLVKMVGLEVDLGRDFTPMLFPQGSMFWTRTDFLKRFFKLPLAFRDFPAEPIPTDGTLAHALERLFAIWGLGMGFQIARVSAALARRQSI